jgi:hypothetical protein
MANALETIRPLFSTGTLPGLGPERRPEAKSLSEAESDLNTTLATTGLTGEAASLVRSATLLWHDHLDESHRVSQGIKSADGSFVHGIMHRREPDYSNAKYWFNRAGLHPTFPEISSRAKGFLAGSSLAHLTEGDWDSFAMVDAVAAIRVGSGEYSLLQQVQQTEFEVLLERFCG